MSNDLIIRLYPTLNSSTMTNNPERFITYLKNRLFLQALISTLNSLQLVVLTVAAKHRDVVLMMNFIAVQVRRGCWWEIRSAMCRTRRDRSNKQYLSRDGVLIFTYYYLFPNQLSCFSYYNAFDENKIRSEHRALIMAQLIMYYCVSRSDRRAEQRTVGRLMLLCTHRPDNRLSSGSWTMDYRICSTTFNRADSQPLTVILSIVIINVNAIFKF